MDVQEWSGKNYNVIYDPEDEELRLCLKREDGVMYTLKGISLYIFEEFKLRVAANGEVAALEGYLIPIARRMSGRQE